MNNFIQKKLMQKNSYFALALLIISISIVVHAARINPLDKLPEFTQLDSHAWINSEPLMLSDVRGKVLLIDIWSYGCWNCYRSFPWLNSLEQKFVDQDFLIIGIHTPEFDHEKDRANVVKHADKFMLHHPIMMDNNFAYWKSLGNKYWPSYYIVDKEGNIRDAYVGETHAGDRNAKRIEKAIAKLLKE